jgi:hypothetical protein
VRIPRPTYANVVATLALFVALGGASYAAVTLPRNSVGSAQLRNGSVTLSKAGFAVGMAAGALGHAVSVGTVARFQCLGNVPCSIAPPRPPPPKVIAVATLKLSKPAPVLVLASLSVSQSRPSIQSGTESDTLDVEGGADVPRPFLNAANGYSATVTGEHVEVEQPGTHRYYLKVRGYVSSPTQATAGQIVAIALPGGEITSCPSARVCAR